MSTKDGTGERAAMAVMSDRPTEGDQAGQGSERAKAVRAVPNLSGDQLRSMFDAYQPQPLAADPQIDQTQPKPAGVLVPLVAGADGWHVLLTQRTSHLTHHAGQISFPGGRVEPDDPSATIAALREAEEEISLARDRVELIGQLDDYRTVTNYRVTPVVGLITDTGPLKADANEVAAIFQAPLAHFLNPDNFERHDRAVDNRSRSFYAVPYEGYFIWGATAAMLKNLASVIQGATA